MRWDHAHVDEFVFFVFWWWCAPSPIVGYTCFGGAVFVLGCSGAFVRVVYQRSPCVTFFVQRLSIFRVYVRGSSLFALC